MTRVFHILLTFAPLMMLSTACVHKDLRDEITVKPSHKVQVVFDWEKAPFANAQNMALYIYPENKDMIPNWFSNNTGGEIKLQSGAYTAVCHNNDNTYDLLVRNEHAHDLLEIYTNDVFIFEGQGISTRGIPRAPGTESEPLRASPPMCYGTHERDINIVDDIELQTVTMYPEELVCHYTVEFVDVKNLSNYSITMDGTISSLASGYFPGKLEATKELATHTFTLSPDESINGLRASFLTFGVTPGDPTPHKISIYAVTRQRTGMQYTFDVTDQVNNAPDPKHVLIRIEGLELPDLPDNPPDPNNPEAGMGITVENWTTEYHTISMK